MDRESHSYGEMRTNRFLILLACAAAILLGMGGCTMNQQTDTGRVLTERQIAILREQGLDTDYEALPLSQRQAIDRIEQMLTWLETRYGGTFCYQGYTAGSVAEPETLLAYPEGSFPELGLISVTCRDGSDHFSDDYPLLLMQEVYRRRLEDVLSQCLVKDSFRVAVVITETELSDPNCDPADLDGKILGQNEILLDAGAYDEQALAALSQDCARLLGEHRLGGRYELALLRAGVLPGITQYNYNDYVTGDACLAAERFFVD